MTIYQNLTTEISTIYDCAYLTANTHTDMRDAIPVISHKSEVQDSTSMDDNNNESSSIPMLDSVISLALSYTYVIGARAFEWQGNIILAVITTPFILKSERDSAKLELKEDIIAITDCKNIIVTFDGEVYRNIQGNISDSEKERLFKLASSRS